ncbi:hypothetical protein B0H15DRAFT_833587 [Mycena belliarum]|uniref:Uncharacterized protein n=1 Tax=Mycena belliarum TaxID=1033014 RepID=A0AAD6XW97_9AGAR|nr:hypothetical protein B0H15DRAFT_833587 [Mycena belliae]
MAPASTKELMARAKQRRQHAPPPSSTPSSPGFPSTPMPPIFNLNSTPGPFSSGSTLNIRGTSMAQLKNFGERELKRVKLDPCTESDFRTYLATTSKDERDALQAIWTLQLRDQLSKLTQNTAEAWTPSNALEKTARRNIYSLLLLPNIQLYAGTLGDVILLAMRAASTPDLPDSDSVHVDELTAWLGEEISQARYAIKKKIIENAGANVADIAEVLVSLVHTQHVPHTLGLYMRLALLRRHIGFNHSANAFWGKVDDELEAFREGGTQSFVELLEDIYADDIEQFNDPSTTEYTVKSFTDPNFTCPRWLRELYKVAPQVKRLPKQKSKSKKRKRVISEDDDEAQGPHNNGTPQDEDQVPEGAGGAGPSGEGVLGEGGAGGSNMGTGEQLEESY